MSVLKLAPNFAQKSEVLFKLAVIFGKTYQLEQAINYFKLATLESSGSPSLSRKVDILIKMGICYGERKEYAEALKSFEAALAAGEQSIRILQHLTWSEFLLLNPSKALEYINKAITLKESDSDNYYIQGRIFLSLEKFTESKDSLVRAINLNQQKAIYLASLGVVNCQIKNFTEAFDNFLKATHLDQSIPEVWFDIGVLYEIHQQMSEASVAYQRAIDVAPDYTEAITRKNIISNPDPACKTPLPSFIHPEFRIPDTMVPLKTFINNQKVKKASEPCFAVQMPASPQRPNPIVISYIVIILDKYF